MARKKKNTQTEKPAPSHYAVFLSPIITEKTSGEDKSRVAFRVRRSCSKAEIKEAVEHVFGVQVAAVRTVNMLGKVKRTARSEGRRPSFKKAYVTLKEGQTINLVEGV